MSLSHLPISPKVYLWGFGESIHPKEMENIVWTPRVVKLKAVGPDGCMDEWMNGWMDG